jgi:hypothetical protein
MYSNEFEPYLNIIDFLIEEIKNLRREKIDLEEKNNKLIYQLDYTSGELERLKEKENI